MRLLRVKDNAQIRKDRFSEITGLTQRIADKTLGQLEQEGIFVFPEALSDMEDLDGEQVLLQSVNDFYRTFDMMGFIGHGDERLTVESRFCKEGEDYFLQYLLDRVVDCPNIADLETDANGDNRIFSFLLFLFSYYLRQAMRKGLFKKYIRKSYNDSSVKGGLDAARHIKQNIPFVGNVAYNCREFSYDNSLTELVRHTIEFIKGKPYGNNMLCKVREEVKLVVNATPDYAFCKRQKIIEENQKNAVRHAYYKEYLALQQLCLWILRYQKHQIGTGTRQIYGILFDGAWLWEEYVASLISRKGQEYFYHPRNKRGEGAQRLFDGNVGLIYPDFIGRDAANRSVADAKYKPIQNIGNRDYLQVLAYMYRFDAKIGYYLYPETRDETDLKLRMNSGSTFESNVSVRNDVFVTKHGLIIPSDAVSYEDFVIKMGEREREFIQPFVQTRCD